MVYTRLLGLSYLILAAAYLTLFTSFPQAFPYHSATTGPSAFSSTSWPGTIMDTYLGTLCTSSPTHFLHHSCEARLVCPFYRWKSHHLSTDNIHVCACVYTHILRRLIYPMSWSLLNMSSKISQKKLEISKREFITWLPNFALLVLPVLVTGVRHLGVISTLRSFLIPIANPSPTYIKFPFQISLKFVQFSPPLTLLI